MNDYEPGYTNDDLDYSKDLYKENSNRLNKAYIIFITFIVLFFFGAFLPYVTLQHKLETGISDEIITSLSKLSKLTQNQYDILKSIQDHVDNFTFQAIMDYQNLDEYYRKLELLESEAITSKNNLSGKELEEVSPTFLFCNEKFYSDIHNWTSCNAKFISTSVNSKILLRFKELPEQLRPLVAEARNNLLSFLGIVSSVYDTNKNSQIPLGIEPAEWNRILNEISVDTGQLRTLRLKAEQVLNLTSRSPQSVVWDILKTPSSSGIAYNNYFRPASDTRIGIQNDSKNQLKQGIKDLSSRFEQIEFPVVGKIPLGLANAVIAFPPAIGLGSLICSYYLGQTIRQRLVFHRIFKKMKITTSFDRELYPIWVDPLDSKLLYRYFRLTLFIFVPLIFLLAITILIFSSPINLGSSTEIPIFGMSENSLLAFGVIIGFILTSLGIFIILRESRVYGTFLKLNKL